MNILSLFKKKRKTVLILGGGSARGMAHIGVLKVLESEGIPIDCVVGTSIGAMVGAGYCVGIPTDTMEENALKFSWDQLFDPCFPRIGIIEGKKLENIIDTIIFKKGFDDIKIPLAIVTTDIEKNEVISFTSGDLKKVIRASCSWPGIFNPVEIGGRLLVDGGVKSSVPTQVAKTLWPKSNFIAVDVGFCVKTGTIDNILQITLQAFQIMGEELNRHQSKVADVVIRPDLRDIDQIAFDRAEESIEEGSRAARQAIPKIKRLLGI